MSSSAGVPFHKSSPAFFFCTFFPPLAPPFWYLPFNQSATIRVDRSNGKQSRQGHWRVDPRSRGGRDRSEA